MITGRVEAQHLEDTRVGRFTTCWKLVDGGAQIMLHCSVPYISGAALQQGPRMFVTRQCNETESLAPVVTGTRGAC